MTDKELIAEIKKLYDKFESVKKYYQLELSGDSEKVLSEYKSKIKKEYFPNRGYGRARSSVSRKVITEFKKISIHPKDLIELILYRTEMMLEYTNAYGDIDEPFYNSLCKSFEQACNMIKQEKLEPYFKDYCNELVGKSSYLGWGVSYSMRDMYEEYFN